MKVEISDTMVEKPSLFRQEWEDLGMVAPKVGARFHALFSEYDIPKSPAYYREWAEYILNYGPTEDLDGDVFLAVADALVKSETSGAKYLLQRIEGTLPKRCTVTLPVSGASMMLILDGCRRKYGTYLSAYEPTTEDDLFALVERGRQLRHRTKEMALRTKFRKNSALIHDYMRFLRLNIKWCNEAVFSKIDKRERKLLAKECVLAGMELRGVPLEVYSRGRDKSFWILQSDEWPDSAKIELMNGALAQFSAGGDSFFSNEWVGALKHDRGFARHSWRGISMETQEYYGPLLFPSRIVLDLRNSLNATGFRNLLGYLYVSPLKVKVRLTPDEQASVLSAPKDYPRYNTHFNKAKIDAFADKLKKHFV